MSKKTSIAEEHPIFTLCVGVVLIVLVVILIGMVGRGLEETFTENGMMLEEEPGYGWRLVLAAIGALLLLKLTLNTLFGTSGIKYELQKTNKLLERIADSLEEDDDAKQV